MEIERRLGRKLTDKEKRKVEEKFHHVEIEEERKEEDLVVA